MDKKEFAKLSDPNYDGPPYKTINAFIDIAYEFTNCVAQLKRIADHTKDISPYLNMKANEDLDKAMDKLKSIPSCDGALRTAVENVIEYSKGLHSHDGSGYIGMLYNALSASPKPRDESELADAVAIEFGNLQNLIDHTDSDIFKTPPWPFIIQIANKLQSALDAYREAP